MKMEQQNEMPITKRLNVNKITPLTFFEISILPLLGIGLASSYYKIIALHNNIYYAAYALVNAWKTDQRDLTGDISQFPMFERTMHLQNAYITYNNCVDYVYQVLFFYYDLDSCVNKAKSYDDIVNFEECVKAKRRDEFDRKIKDKNSELYKAIKKFREEIKGLGSKANNIKHDAGFWIDGNHINTFGTTIKNIAGEEVNLSQIIIPPRYNISDEIEFLVNVHNEFIVLEKVLFEQLAYKAKIKEFLHSMGLNK